jgi:hypothetical protein
MHIIPFEPSHLRGLILQESQAWMSPMLKQDYGAYLKNSGPCFTAAHEDRVLVCSGLVNVWENRAIAWALMSADAGRSFVRIFRAIRSFLDLQDIRRIEATVDANFDQGHRLMRMLGFTLETPEPMRSYLPDGRDCHLYARVV